MPSNICAVFMEFPLAVVLDESWEWTGCCEGNLVRVEIMKLLGLYARMTVQGVSFKDKFQKPEFCPSKQLQNILSVWTAYG